MRPFLVAILSLSTASVAVAQAPSNPTLPEGGVREIGISGRLVSRPERSYDLQLGYGPFESPRLQYGGELGILQFPGNRATSLGVFANYHFPRGASQLPFIGGYLGTLRQTDGSTNLWGIQGGIKFFLNSAVALTPQLVYRKPGKSSVPETIEMQASLSLFLR